MYDLGLNITFRVQRFPTHRHFCRERGIRTPGPCGSTVFKTAAFDRSAISLFGMAKVAIQILQSKRYGKINISSRSISPQIYFSYHKTLQ